MRLLFILAFVLFSVPLIAQQEDATPKAEKELVTTRLRKNIQSITSLKVDTLKPAVVDSLSQKVDSKKDSLKSLQGRLNLTSRQDSLLALVNKPLDSLNQKVNGAKAALQNRADSIESLANGVTGKIEGVENKLQAKIGEGEQKVNQVEDKINESITKAEKEVEDVTKKATTSVNDVKNKVESQLNSVTGEKIKLPDVQQKLDIPKVDLSTESLNSIAPGVDVPKLEMDKVNLNLDPSLKTNVPGIEGTNITNLSEKVKLPEIDKSSISELGKVEEISDKLKDVDKNLAAAEEYEKELQKIKEGDLTEVEKRLGDVKQVKGLSTEINKVTAQQAQYEAMIKKYQDKKLLQEEMMRKVANVANDKLAEHAAKVQQAQSKLSKAKKGVGQIKSVKDIFKVKSDELVGKKFYERLVPGLTTQVYNKDYFQMDVALQVGYRLMPRLTAGVGVTYRLGFDKQFEYFVHSEEIYGGRVYVDFAIKSGVFLHGEFEALKYTTPPSTTVPTVQTEYKPNTVYGSYFGLGKRFNVSRQIRASVIALYRVEYEGELPSMSKFNIRMGFDYRFRNKKESSI